MPAWIADGLHRVAAGHLVPANASVPSLRSRDIESVLQVGHHAVVQGSIDHSGGVILARGVIVWADVKGGHEVVVGPNAHIRGDVSAAGRVVIQHGAKIDGNVKAGSDAHLLGSCTVGTVTAAGDIIIVGSPTTGQLSPGGRIQTRPW